MPSLVNRFVRAAQWDCLTRRKTKQAMMRDICQAAQETPDGRQLFDFFKEAGIQPRFSSKLLAKKDEEAGGGVYYSGGLGLFLCPVFNAEQKERAVGVVYHEGRHAEHEFLYDAPQDEGLSLKDKIFKRRVEEADAHARAEIMEEDRLLLKRGEPPSIKCTKERMERKFIHHLRYMHSYDADVLMQHYDEESSKQRIDGGSYRRPAETLNISRERNILRAGFGREAPVYFTQLGDEEFVEMVLSNVSPAIEQAASMVSRFEYDFISLQKDPKREKMYRSEIESVLAAIQKDISGTFGRNKNFKIVDAIVPRSMPSAGL